MIISQTSFVPVWPQILFESNSHSVFSRSLQSLYNTFLWGGGEGQFLEVPFLWTCPISGETEAQKMGTEPAEVVSKVWTQSLVLRLSFTLLRNMMARSPGGPLFAFQSTMDIISRRTPPPHLACTHHSTAPGTGSFSLRALELCISCEWTEKINTFSPEHQCTA